jgi:hypothetical protein
MLTNYLPTLHPELFIGYCMVEHAIDSFPHSTCNTECIISIDMNQWVSK